MITLQSYRTGYSTLSLRRNTANSAGANFLELKIDRLLHRPFARLALRIALGLMFIAHAELKYFLARTGSGQRRPVSFNHT